MNIHAVVCQGNNNVLVGLKSCYCENCIGGIQNCRHWQPHTIVVISTSQQIYPEQETSIPLFETLIPEPNTLIPEPETHIQELETPMPESEKQIPTPKAQTCPFEVGNFVAAKYG
ncbi:hypothetical protein DPMN_061303 [Dreissena polymorpha]|uniref:Uncharacterized protein n=1 Tax=Dreissena polymorpha TaxID=45954 RepID=A0A9D4C7L4_DREPO|nr:hypothetical protein DPMN_061303 [Dreissena polymorpha]